MMDDVLPNGLDARIEESNRPALAPQTRRMLEGRILPTLLILSLPTILVMVVQISVSFAEARFVKDLGHEAQAAITYSFYPIVLMNGMSGAAMGGAIASAIARALGAGRREDAERVVFHALAIAVGMGALFTVGALLGGPAIYRAMGATGTTLDAALEYSNIVFLGSIPFWIFNAFASVFRGTGNTALPAIISAIGAVIAICVSPLLIFGVGPIPPLGLTGAACGVLSFYAFGLTVSAWFILTRRAGLLPSWRAFRFEARLFKDVLLVGIPSSLNTILATMTGATMVFLIGPFGSAAVAGFGMASRMEFLMMPVVFGLGSSLVPLVGANVGAGNFGRARRATWFGVVLSALFCGLIGTIAALVPDAWMRFFSEGSDTVETGALYLRTVGPSYAFFGIGLVLYFASQGVGSAIAPLAAGVARLGIAMVGGMLVTHVFDQGLHSVFLVMAAALTGFGISMIIVVLVGPLHRERTGRRWGTNSPPRLSKSERPVSVDEGIRSDQPVG
jgi:putative MATE family efflux protein